MEKPGWEFGGVSAGVKGPVICNDLDPKAGDFAVRRGRQFAVHVVVAGEGCGRDILDAVLNPLDRLAQYDRRNDGADIAWINTNFVAKAAADVRADDANLALRDT